MTAAEIRQSFLDFFEEKKHTTVPSASLMPQSPGLLFTNAGMNQFVPYFLGTEKAPYDPARAADTQKCIRAGGKHNDLEDVGYDTYHHTFFEMLGNWSFGDYFKEEAISWAWELIVDRWGVPAERLYATVYAPSEGDPSEFDQEAWDLWAGLFQKAGLDPQVHIVNGNVKDNFWMMGETGPCGPCSELHVDLTPEGDTKGSLVNQDSDLCIEIWNLVFIQYNAEADGTFRDLPARHVDTGMGFERACSLIQNTKGFTDFSQKPTNYATDVFQPYFRTLEGLSGAQYVDVYPGEQNDALERAIAFRVIADHIRTLGCSIADGILPGNTGRNYVLRRILRRAVKYGRTLGFDGGKPFLPELVPTLVQELGTVFPELVAKQETLREVLAMEEDSFNKTLDRGLELFEKVAAEDFPPAEAFKLYDTFGFPLDLTSLLCRERGLKLDEARVEVLMEEARERSRSHQKKTIVRAVDVHTTARTEFVGFDQDECQARVLELHDQLVITDRTVLFTEMGGQEGDRGDLSGVPVLGTQRIGEAVGHLVEDASVFTVGQDVVVRLDSQRRTGIEAHHTATHLLHWALHEVISPEATQQGSGVSPERLRFDFNSKAVTAAQLTEIEEKVNASIERADQVSWTELPHAEVKERADIMQFFGDKYGNRVRVVQIGGGEGALDGFSMELCGGTHVRNTREIGLFKIRSEGAIASGVRRIEALCGAAAEAYLVELEEQEREARSVALAKYEAAKEAVLSLGGSVSAVPASAGVSELKALAANTEKQLKKLQASQAARVADEALNQLLAESPSRLVESFEGPANLSQELMNGLKKRQFSGCAFMVVDDGERLHLAAICGTEALAAGEKAGDMIRTLAPIAGGKGGGKPDLARGAAPEREKLAALLEAAR